MRKERRDMTRVRILRMKIPRRYRGECEGAWKCAAAARISMTRVKNAAIGWTIRIEEMLFLVSNGRSNVFSWASVNPVASEHRS